MNNPIDTGGRALMVSVNSGYEEYDPSTVVEINTAGQIVSQVGGEDVHTGLLDYFSGFDRVAANVIVANWWGHVAEPPQGGPHLVEFNPANMLVWRWGTQTQALQITNALFVR